VSAAPSPAPAETPVTPLRPALALTAEEAQLLAKADAKAAARDRAMEKARRFFVRASVIVVVVPPLLMLVGQGWSEEIMIALLIPFWGLLLPSSGLALVAFAAVRRTARDAATLLVAILSLIASILLLEPAGFAGSEVMLNRHAAALEVIARDLAKAPIELRTQVARGLADVDHAQAAAEAAYEILTRLDARGITRAATGREFVAFEQRAMFGWNALYLTGGRGMDRAAMSKEMGCRGLQIRPAGGDWYLYRCALTGYD
jgi:hypothetical protein